MTKHAWHSLWAAALALLVLTPSMRAGDPGALLGLSEAMLQRLEEIAALPAPGKAEKKEAKAFGKAIPLLEAYTGVDDKTDLKTLAKLASSVFKAKSSDADVVAGVVDLRDLVEQIAELARQDALNDLGLLSNPKSVAAVDKAVAKGDKKLGDGLVAWPGNHGKGAKKINAATLTYRKALAVLEKKQASEAKKTPNDARVTGISVESEDPQIFHEFAVQADLQVDQPTPELTVALRAALKDHVDAEVAAFTQVTLGETTLFDLPAGASTHALEFPMPVVRDEEFRKISSAEPVTDQEFGRALAVSGTTMVVGGTEDSAAGPVWILERDQGGLLEWGEVARLVPEPDVQNPGNEEEFGYSVAISGDTVVVGARKHDLGPFGDIEDAGAAYVFQRDQGGSNAWGQVAKLVADPIDDPGCGLTQDQAYFGKSVAIDGDTIVVGAPGTSWCDGSDQQHAGEAYVFERDEGGSDAWGQTARLRASLPGDNDDDRFGHSVAILGDHIAVGAINGDASTTNEGTVDWFERSAQTQQWFPITRITADDGFASNGDGFGASLALTADTLVVGAPRTDLPGAVDAGAVWVFDPTILDDECLLPGNDCSSIARLTAEDAATDDFFGHDVAIMITPAGRQGIVVGAPRGDYGGVDDAGAAYVFLQDSVDPEAYDQRIKIITNGEDADVTADNLDAYGAPDPDDPYALFGPNTFGGSIATDGETLAIGAPLANQPDSEIADSGAVWVFGGLEFVVAGDYYVAVEVDPHDRLIETASDDAELNVFPAAEVVTFNDDRFNTPNLSLLPNPTIEPEVILFDTTNGVQSTLIGIDVTVLMTGKHDAPLGKRGVPAESAFMKVILDGTATEAGIWDEAAGGYVSPLYLPPLFADEPLELHLDLKLPPPPGGVDNYPATLAVAIAVPPGESEYDPADPFGDPLADNVRKLDTDGYVVIELPDCTYSQSFTKGLGNEQIGASVDFEANLDLTKNLLVNEVHTLFPTSKAMQGAVASAQGNVDIRLMGSDLELLQFRALAERDPVEHYAFFGADLLFYNPITSDFNVLYSVGPYDTTDIETDPGNPLEDPPEGFQFCDGDNGCEAGFIYQKEWSVDKSTNDPKGVKKQATFYPGGIPVTVQGVAEGKIGFELTGIAADEFSLQAKPNAGISATVKFAVGDCDYLCVGAGGEIVLVQDEFIAKAGIGMTVLEDEETSPADRYINAAMCFRVANELTLLNGKLFVFARYPWILWCSGFFFDFPCGFTIKTSKKDIIDWSAFVYCSELVNEYKPICCEPLDDGTDQTVCEDAGSNGIGVSICASEACHE